jgi:hypothetical protein
VVNDEGAEVFQLTSRYSVSGKANLGVYLAGFDGGTYTADRVSRESPTIPRLTLSVVLAIQPSVLDELAREKANQDRGFLARFLFCVPVSRIGSRPTRRPAVPSEIRANWTGLLRRIASQVKGQQDPVVLVLGDNAQEMWWSWSESLEPRLNPDIGDLRHCGHWRSKAQGHILQLAALLHVGSEQPLKSPVGADTLLSAITLWEYFAGHAKKAFATMRETDEMRIARKLLRWVERTDDAQFSKRDAWKGIEGGYVKNVADVDSALKMLSDRGYLRRLEQDRTGVRGRPASERYAVNPALRAANIARNRQGIAA